MHNYAYISTYIYILYGHEKPITHLLHRHPMFQYSTVAPGTPTWSPMLMPSRRVSVFGGFDGPADHLSTECLGALRGGIARMWDAPQKRSHGRPGRKIINLIHISKKCRRIIQNQECTYDSIARQPWQCAGLACQVTGGPRNASNLHPSRVQDDPILRCFKMLTVH